ncbi:protein LURP-one-related 5-like [Curcuma longa]|uniref:protein LURP-one-related 5-like n=1 Tax=Curcuma longa TaxID=136217 RepID=UPI003D9E5CE8
MEKASEASEVAAGAVVGERFCSEAERELTVRKTSVFFYGDGFAAYDHATGDLVFRVDTYARSGSPAFADRQILLMDPSGDPILTLRRKWPSLHQRWEAFLGERKEGQRPLFTVRRSSIFGSDRSGFEVEVDSNGYRIEGCFAKRCCRVIYETRGGGGGGAAVVVAEIKRKVDTLLHVVLGRDVFSLCLRPHCDSAFAMGLVVVLDQITGDEAEEEVEQVDSPISESAG